MDENTSEMLRDKIEASRVEVPKHLTIKILIASAAVIAGLMIIPQSRGSIVNAAGRLAQVFGFANGETATVIIEENENMAEIEYDPGFSYISVENDRVFFIPGETKEDITERIGGTDYFRYEQANADGGRSVILIGDGSIEGTYGWICLPEYI